MSLAVDLMGVGLPQEQATRLGFSDLTTIAGVGTAQSGAAAIPASVNNVLATTSSGQTALVLSSSVEMELPTSVTNSTATAALLYPPTGGAFNSGSANAAISIAQNESVTVIRKSTTRWEAFLTANPSILATPNTWTAVQVFSEDVFFRSTTPSLYQAQGAPTAKTVTSAITAAELLTSIITTTGVTAPSIHQLPTGTLLAAAIPGIAVGDSFDWSLINTGTGASDDATITVNTDHTIVGNPTAGALTDATIISGSARFRTRYTAANTFVTYRIA